MPLDTQIVELLGRQRLIAELVRDGLEVAIPVRDRGVDLVAYAELNSDLTRFSSKPIQMKAASKRVFSINKKYTKVADLILAFVWHLDEPEKAVTYAMTYAEAIGIATEMGYADSPSWDAGVYTNTKPGEKLVGLLDKYRMGPRSWWDLVTVGNLLRQETEPEDS